MSENVMEQVKIFDTTLRDGEQMPGVSFTPDDKVAIAGRLAAMGVDIIEAGFPVSNRGEFEVVRTIAKAVDGPVVCALARTEMADVEAAWGAIEPAKHKGGARIHTFVASSDVQMEKKLKRTPDQIVVAAGRAVDYARQFTDDVEFSPEDASRTSFDFMMRVIMVAVEHGATTVNIPDTVGYALPDEYAERIRAAREMVDRQFGEGTVTIAVHTHDDMGLATANIIAGIVKGGAREAQTTIARIGERAGNASMEQIVAILQERYADRFYTNIDSTQCYAVGHEVARRAGIMLQPNTPIIGTNAFKHKAGTHQKGVIEDPKTYEHMPARRYGQTPAQLEVANLSGNAAVFKKVAGLGIAITPNEVRVVTEKVKAFAQAESRHAADNDIERIAVEVSGEQIRHSRYAVSSFDVVTQGSVSRAKVTVDDNWQKMCCVQEAESADGAIDAGVKAVNQATYFTGKLVKWRGDSRQVGSESPAGIFVVVEQAGQEVEVYAEAASVDQATIEAYVQAVNLFRRIDQRRGQQDEIAAI